MKVTIQNTNEIVYLNGSPARIWEGETESGIKVHFFVALIAIQNDEPRIEEFEPELQQLKPPTQEAQEHPEHMKISFEEF